MSVKSLHHLRHCRDSEGVRASLAGIAILVASTCYAMPGDLVTKEYANHLHQVAKTSLENGKLNSADLDLAIKSDSEKYYRETLEPRLDAAEPIGSTEPSVDTTDRDLISGCDDYAVALMNMGSAYFDARDRQEVGKWKVAAEKAANQCDCIVKNPATIQNIADWRDVIDTSGTQKQRDAREAKANQYLAICSSD
jgi:hypothetical protein